MLREGPDEIVDPVRALGLYLGCLAAHPPLLQANLEERERQSARLITCIAAATLVGAPTIITHTGSPYGWHVYGTPSRPPGNPTDKVEEGLTLFRERFMPVVGHAEAKG